jgi:predicted permease
VPGRHRLDDTKGFVTDVTRVAPEYFAALNVPIVAGRNFTAADTPSSPGVAIVNETFARKLWPNENALGRVFHNRALDGPAFEIVGVCADYKVRTLAEGTTPYVHYAYSQRPAAGESIIARTRGSADALLASMRRALVELEPNVVFLDDQTMTAQVDMTLMPARLGAFGASGVGAMAMLLAAVGLYGVIAYSVSSRTREIGIRMALGAGRQAVVGLVMRQGLGLAAAGIAAGALFSAGAAKALSGVLYGVGFLDPVTWASAIITLLSVAALANALPARRAVLVDPSQALRAD